MFFSYHDKADNDFSYNENVFKFINYLLSNLSKCIYDLTINDYKYNLNLTLKSTEDIEKISIFLKKHTMTQFVVLSDIFSVDLFNIKMRFLVIYCLLSIRFNSRLRLNLFLNEKERIKSLTNVFNSAGWAEREIWDLFGLFFKQHIDLRRILTDYGFEGFPLRKDFPSSGFVELRYDDSLKRIVYEPLEVTQEFRFFDFESPWDNISNLY